MRSDHVIAFSLDSFSSMSVLIAANRNTDQATGICYKDCDASYDAKCKRPPASTPVQDTIEECCKTMPWIEPKYCNSRSKGEYSGAWFADWSGMKCAQDCEPSYGGACKAHDKKENKMFDSAADCCNASKSIVACETTSSCISPRSDSSHVLLILLTSSRLQLDGHEAVRCCVDRYQASLQ